MAIQEIRTAAGKALNEALDKLQWMRFRYNCPLVRAAAKRIPAGDCFYSVNISERYRYVYIDNPKTGCSSLKSALVEMETKDLEDSPDCYDWTIFHDRSRSPLKRLTDLKMGAPLTTLVNRGYRFVTFVRNPYTRLLSCYRDKIMGNKNQKAQILRILGYPATDLERPVSFEEFARAVASQTDYEMNPHWRVQTTQILFEVLDYSFVGRFENYQADFEALFRHVGIPAESIPNVRHLNRTREGRREGCASHFTDEIQALVYERYKKDFDNFGYGFELPE
jgi:hypothetical protein